MTEKSQSKKMEFLAEDEGFITRLAQAIGCHYSKANDRTYNLNRHESAVQGEMGVFAWVHKEGDDAFWISTRKVWVEETRIKALAGKTSMYMNCFPRYTQRSGDSINFDTKNNYQKTVGVLTLMNILL